MIDKSDFLIKAMQSLNSSLELPIVLENMFKFLRRYFPIEGVSLHKLIPEKSGIEPLFFISSKGIHEEIEFFVLPEKEVLSLAEYQKNPKPLIFNFEELEADTLVKNLFLRFLTNTKPDLLVLHLATENEIVGHFVMFSRYNMCFDEKHLELFGLLTEILTSAMINIHHHSQLKKSREKLLEENTSLKRQYIENNTIIAKSNAMYKVIEMVEILAEKDVQILILGETGTGKEVLADYIVENSKRKDKVFLKVNCGAIPETLIDSELFGYEKGAFTGAYSTKKGYFEQANGGTLFLDEIGELSLQAQVRLLRILQFGLVERVGGTNSVPVDVRILAATNRNLENMLQQGTFREDLFYRLQAFPVKIPALRERKEDILLLLNHFTDKISNKLKIQRPKIDISKHEKILAYSWPGNVRELENLVERSIILNKSEEIDYSKYLPTDPLWYLENLEAKPHSSLKEIIKSCIFEIQEESKTNSPSFQNKDKQLESLDELMKKQIIKALEKCNGRISGKNGAAQLLKIKDITLRKRMEKLGISCKKRWE